MAQIEYVEITTVSKEDLKKIYAIEEKIFDKPFSTNQIQDRLSSAHKMFAIIAKADGKFVGYKIGYAKTSKVFHSWIGGVLPEYRDNGIAKKLMNLQLAWCKKKGFQKITTSTYNKFRVMLLLNIRAGFNVVGAAYMPDQDDYKIRLIKEI